MATKCNGCNGTGRISGKPCTCCYGSGKVDDIKKPIVKIGGKNG